jgi:hypothetical protein
VRRERAASQQRRDRGQGLAQLSLRGIRKRFNIHLGNSFLVTGTAIIPIQGAVK